MEQKVVQKAPEQAKKSKPNLTGIPTQMKLDFERRSGLSFDDVRVHYNSDKPRKIGALAYTQIPQVHIGPGQERHLRHELGHVVQQKQGIVRPTTWFNGLPINDSPTLEDDATTGAFRSNIHTITASPRNFTQPIQKLDNRLFLRVCDILRRAYKKEYIEMQLKHFEERCEQKIPHSGAERDSYIFSFCDFLENCRNVGAYDSSEWIVTFGDQELATGARAYTETGKPIYATSCALTKSGRYYRNKRTLATDIRNRHIKDIALTGTGTELTIPRGINRRRTKAVFDHPYTTGRSTNPITQEQVQKLCRDFFNYVKTQAIGRAQLTIRAVDAGFSLRDSVYDLSPVGFLMYGSEDHEMMRSHADSHRATAEETDSQIDPRAQSLTIKFVNFKVYFNTLFKLAKKVNFIFETKTSGQLQLNKKQIKILNRFISSYNRAFQSSKWPAWLRMHFRHTLDKVPDNATDIILTVPITKRESDLETTIGNIQEAALLAKMICNVETKEDLTYKQLTDRQTGKDIMQHYKYDPTEVEFSDASESESEEDDEALRCIERESAALSVLKGNTHPGAMPATTKRLSESGYDPYLVNNCLIHAICDALGEERSIAIEKAVRRYLFRYKIAKPGEMLNADDYRVIQCIIRYLCLEPHNYILVVYDNQERKIETICDEGNRVYFTDTMNATSIDLKGRTPIHIARDSLHFTAVKTE